MGKEEGVTRMSEQVAARVQDGAAVPQVDGASDFAQRLVVVCDSGAVQLHDPPARVVSVRRLVHRPLWQGRL